LSVATVTPKGADSGPPDRVGTGLKHGWGVSPGRQQAIVDTLHGLVPRAGRLSPAQLRSVTVTLAGRRELCAHSIGLGVQRPGAFAELVALPMTNVWQQKPGLDEDVAAIFDPFGNAVHTTLSFPLVGEDVLITGAGPIGLMAIPVVRHAGARYTGHVGVCYARFAL